MLITSSINVRSISGTSYLVKTLFYLAGEVATFECTLVSADETTKIQWLKDNKPLHDKLADRVIQTSDDKSFKLQIQNVHESDSGIYIARAMNGDGQATCTAQLVVQERKFVNAF